MAVGDPITYYVDYSSYYERIATALETVATNSTTIKNTLDNIKTDLDTLASNSTTVASNSTTIASKQTVIADKQTAIETYQKKLKELGEGAGIHVLSPNEIFGFIKLYQLLIEQGKMLDEGDKVPEAQQANAKARVKEMAAKVQALLGEISAF